jgi:hypothetical protein
MPDNRSRGKIGTDSAPPAGCVCQAVRSDGQSRPSYGVAAGVLARVPAATSEKVTLGGGRRQAGRAFAGGCGFAAAAEPVEQVGSGGVEEAVAVQGELVDQRQRGGRVLYLADGDGAVEGYDRCGGRPRSAGRRGRRSAASRSARLWQRPRARRRWRPEAGRRRTGCGEGGGGRSPGLRRSWPVPSVCGPARRAVPGNRRVVCATRGGTRSGAAVPAGQPPLAPWA